MAIQILPEFEGELPSDKPPKSVTKPKLTKLQKITVDKLEKGDYNDLTQGNVTRISKKLVTYDPEFAEKIMPKILQYEVTKNPKINTIKEAIKFLASKFKGENKKQFREVVSKSSSSDASDQDDEGKHDEKTPSLTKPSSRNIPDLIDLKKSEVLEGKSISPGSSVVEKSTGGGKGIVEKVIGAGKTISSDPNVAGAIEATQKGGAEGLFSWGVTSEFPEVKIWENIIKNTPIGWSKSDSDTLDRMMDESTKNDVSSSEAFSIIGKLIVNPTKIGHLIKVRTEQWSTEKLNDVSIWFKKLKQTFPRAQKASTQFETYKDKSQKDWELDQEKGEERGSFGGSKPTPVVLPTKPHSFLPGGFSASDIPTAGIAGGSTDPPSWWNNPKNDQARMGFDMSKEGYLKYLKARNPEKLKLLQEQERQTKLAAPVSAGDLLDDRGVQLAKELKSYNHFILKKLQAFVGRQGENWEISDVDEVYSLGEDLDSLDSTSSWTEMMSIVNSMIKKIPAGFLDSEGMSKMTSAIKSKISDKVGDPLVNKAWDAKADVKTKTQIEAGEEQETKDKEDKENKDEDGRDLEDPDNPDSKAHKYGVRHSGVGKSELRPELEIGGLELELEQTLEEKLEQELTWSRFDIVGEGFGEGSRGDNKLYRHNLKQQNLRYGQTFKLPKMRREPDYPSQQFIDMNRPNVQNIHQCVLPRGIPDEEGVDRYTNPVESEMVGTYVWFPSDQFDRSTFPSVNQRQHPVRYDMRAGSLNPSDVLMRASVAQPPSHRTNHHVQRGRDVTIQPVGRNDNMRRLKGNRNIYRGVK
jgi:hypothetical protein